MNEGADELGVTPKCRAIRDHLVTYVASMMLGLDTPNATEIAQHLATCPDCSAYLDELTTITAAAYNGQIPAAPSYPMPDLSFLPVASIADPATPWWIDQLGTLIIAFSRDLLASIQRPIHATVTRGTAPTTDSILYQYALVHDDDPELTAMIDFVRMSDTTFDVRINVSLMQRDVLDQAGTPVTLGWDDTRLQGATDHIGHIQFSGVPSAVLERLRIEIAPPIAPNIHLRHHVDAD